MVVEPLSVLLSRVWIALVIEIDNAVEASAPPEAVDRFRISFPMWANGLRLVHDGTTVAQLGAAAGAQVNLAGLERWGWIVLGDRRRGDAGFGSHRGVIPSTSVRLTSAGTAVCRVWPDRIAEVEERWRRRFGVPTVRALTELGSQLGAGMPWALPEVHPRDGFYSHPLPTPSEDHPPLAAALGSALTAVTVHQERSAPVSLALSANVLHALGAEPARTRDLPTRTGLAKEAVAVSISYLARHALATRTPGGTIRLTTAGIEAKEEADARPGPDHAQLRLLLDQVLADTHALRDGLHPPTGCWRGKPPHTTRTRHLLDDPAAALPRQPIPLHRGGWPDGS